MDKLPTSKDEDAYQLACSMLNDTETTLEMKRKIDRQTKNSAKLESDTDNEPDSVELIQDKQVTIFTVANVYTNSSEVKIDNWPAADILILTGNTGEPIKAFDRLHDFLLACKTKYPHVIMIAGFLEFTSVLPEYSILFNKFKELEAKTNVHIVTNKVLNILGCTFICAPLWPVPDTEIYIDHWEEIFGSRINQICSSVEDYKFIGQNLAQIAENTNVANLDLHPPVIICTAYPPTNSFIPDLPFRHQIDISLECIKELEKINVAEYWFCGCAWDQSIKHKHLNCTVIFNPCRCKLSEQPDCERCSEPYSYEIYTIKTNTKWQNRKIEEEEQNCPIQ